jgi:tRNA threonylcarbamoyladenosine dehydratase
MLRHMTGGDTEITYGLKTPTTVGELAFLVDEIFKSRSPISGLSTRLTLVRWRAPTEPMVAFIGEGADEQKASKLRLSDLVCMTKEEATRHDKQVLRGEARLEDLYDAPTIDKIESLLKQAAEYEKYVGR